MNDSVVGESFSEMLKEVGADSFASELEQTV